MLTLIVLMMASWYGIYADLERLEYGVIFGYENNIELSKEYWLHSQELMINLDSLKADLSSDKCYQDGKNAKQEKFCEFAAPLKRYAKSVYNSVMTETKANIHNILRLIPNRAQRSNSRNTRALFPFIGSVHRFMYNTATLDVVSKVIEKMNTINREQITYMDSNIRYWTDNLASWSRQYDRRLDSLTESMNGTVNSLMLMYDQLHQDELNIEAMFNAGARTLMDAALASSFIESSYGDLETAIVAGLQGYLSPHLIGLRELRDILEETQEQVSEVFPKFSVSHDDLDYYYTDKCIFLTRTTYSIWVTIRVPIRSVDSSMKLYKVNKFPLPLTKTSSLSSTGLNVPNYLVINLATQTYAEINSKPETCLGNQHNCQESLAYLGFDSPSCALALYLENHMDIKSLCAFRVNNETLTSQVIEIDASIFNYLLINISEIHQANNQKITVKPGCLFCIYPLCETSVLFNKVLVDQRIVNCNNEDVSNVRRYPNNLALALHITANVSQFYVHTHFERNTILEESLKTLNESMIRTLARAQNSSVDLKEISDNIVKNDTKFMNEITQKLGNFNKEVSTSGNWFNIQGPTMHWAEIAGLVLLVVEIMHILFTIYLFRRISILTSLLGVMAMTKAQPPEHAQTATLHVHHIPAYILYLAIISTILNLLIFSVWLTYKICKRRYSKTYLGISFASELTPNVPSFLSTLPNETSD